MAELNCILEPDFFFEQTDCHWKLERFFRLTWDMHYGQNLMYRLGSHSENFIGYKNIDESKIYTKGTSYIYELPLLSFTFEELAKARSNDGWLTITICKSNSEDYKTFDKFYYLELPPVWDEATPPGITIERVYNKPDNYCPDKYCCAWSKAKELDGSDAENSPDSLDGYCIEFYHKPVGSSSYSKVNGIKWDDEELAKGYYKLVLDTTEEDIWVPEDSGIEGTQSFASHHSKSEVYIEGADNTQFYFDPEKLGIVKKDFYKFAIYPYSHYEGSLLSPSASESDGIEFSKGVVWVNTEARGWIEGQVWVMTSSGWKEAEAVYAYTNDGWKESQ